MLWNDLTREELRTLLPDAIVVVPTGATEQHGPHLPTGTDSIIVTEVVEKAVAEGEFSRPVIVTPTVRVGASDHHLPFNGTLSLSAETLVAVLLDYARSIAACGGRNVFYVNGHGGNRGACMVAASTASTRFGVAAAYADYWSMVAPDFASGGDRQQVPGHAGEFETSMVLAIRPDLVRPATDRAAVHPIPAPANVTVHHARGWRAIDGHTDFTSGASADYGTAALDSVVTGLRRRLQDFDQTFE